MAIRAPVLPDDTAAWAAPSLTWVMATRMEESFFLRSAGALAQPSVWLHLQAQLTLPLTCQRCLGPVATPLVVDRWFRFVADETTAAAEDEDSEEDVLALEPRPSLLELIEDELLMELPLVPMHEVCPESPAALAGAADVPADEAPESMRPNPFAGLARLKK